MKLKEFNWRILHTPLLVLLGSLAASSAWVYFSQQWSDSTLQSRERERVVLSAIRQKSTQADQEKQIIQRYRDAYEDLQRSGTVGPEQRVNWLDALRSASQAARTLGVDYQLSQQTASPIKLDTGAYKLQQSTMKLRINLLHEGDLPSFLRALDAERPGLYLLQSCNLTRGPGGAFSVRYETKLAAECELLWLSLIEAGTAEATKR
ncbi:MAG: hypothetical protein IV108_10450 [Burkholderiales bacterium]|nr:hypothetical protein [Burkholderiales bacterium]